MAKAKLVVIKLVNYIYKEMIMIQYPSYLEEQLAEANKKALSNCPEDRLTGFAFLQGFAQGAYHAHGTESDLYQHLVNHINKLIVALENKRLTKK
jgi:hypothetical protein